VREKRMIEEKFFFPLEPLPSVRPTDPQLTRSLLRIDSRRRASKFAGRSLPVQKLQKINIIGMGRYHGSWLKQGRRIDS